MNDERTNSLALDSASSARPDARWPARTQRLLGELRVLCRNWLDEPLRRTLHHFDVQLHRQAEQTRSHLDQQHYAATRRLLMNEHQAFGQRFIASIDQTFDRLGMPSMKSSEAAPLTLSLLDPLEHDLVAALDQLVARSDIRSGPLLVELGYRLAVLIGAPPLANEALPVGAQAMAKAFRDASRALGLPSVHELLLLQSLESSLIQAMAPLHELLNAHLRAEGILPGLRAFILPRDTARRDRAKNQKQPASAAPVAETEGGQRVAAPDKRDEQPTLQHSGGEDNLPIGGNAVTPEQLQIALAALQEHLSQADERTRLDVNRPQRLREELLIQLNVGHPVLATRVSLSAAQDDTVELIVRLFGRIAQQLPQSSAAQSLLFDLQLPMLRVALTDHGFFEQQEHPARKVLGRIAEIAGDWLDDAGGAVDHSLRTKFGLLVERASCEPPSTALYVSLLSEIEQYMAQLQIKTQLAERRQVDAMHGLECVEQARHRATELIAQRFAQSSSQKVLLARLDRAWSDVLALTLLRHGEQSEIFGTRLAVTDQLLGCLPVGNHQKLQHEVEAGLRQLGMHDEEVVQVAERLLKVNRNEPVGNALHVSDLAMRFGRQQKPRDPLAPNEIEPDPVANALNPVAITTPGPDVLRIHRHLRTLPAGIWFEFIDPSGGRGIRRRLVWYSPLTGHSLFVTRSGQRAQELGEMKLAHEIASTRVREITAGHEDVLDQAWRAVTQELGPQARKTP